VITQLRSASHLLIRILNLENQPSLISSPGGSGYFFFPAASLLQKLGLRRKPIDDWTDKEQSQMQKCYQTCFDRFEAHILKSEAMGKAVVVKEHAFMMSDPSILDCLISGRSNAAPACAVNIPEKYGNSPTHTNGNVTVMPDQFLATFLPIFLIRHPALMYPSMHRALRDMQGAKAAAEPRQMKMQMSLRPTVALYKWYVETLRANGLTEYGGEPWPIVLEADDIMVEPSPAVERVCELAGLDKTLLKYTWDVATPEELAKLPDKRFQRMISTLSESTGIRQDKLAKGIVIVDEVEKWKAEFGEEQARMLEKRVKQSMPDYEYLKSKRLDPLLSAQT
jgi:hypothetical protein